ncbi:MAG TPA: FAD-dependent monooxygenase [Pseudonocardia sp.]
MKLDSVAVLGGGPGGLYAARLLKLAHPRANVAVYEQSPPEATFGFGVALAGRTQRNLDAADPVTQADILAAGLPHDMQMLVDGRGARVHNSALIGIARTELLAVLRRHADAAGVELHYGDRARLADLSADLVVVADGVSSQTRADLAEELGATVETAGCLYLWAGADFALDTAIFAPVTTEHGTFVTHAYPYAADRSTFLIETDEATWRGAGFDASTDNTPVDQSDTAALAYLQDAFAEHLDGHRLIGNRTRWTRFRTVHCDRWTRGNVVLIGDAAHTAHYSVGSGTKLAMEDAIALCDAVTAADDLSTALASYEQARRPQVERLQELARRSRLWWDSFPRRLHLPVDQLMVAYMTRTGNVGLQRLADSNPEIVTGALAQLSHTAPADIPTDDVVAWSLAQPLRRGEHTSACRTLSPEQRDALTAPAEPGPPPSAGTLALAEVDLADPWGCAADALVKQLLDLAGSGWAGFWLTGPPDRAAVLTRLAVGERLRTDTGAVVAVDGPAPYLDDLAAGIVSGRADLVCLVPVTAA